MKEGNLLIEENPKGQRIKYYWTDKNNVRQTILSRILRPKDLADPELMAVILEDEIVRMIRAKVYSNRL